MTRGSEELPSVARRAMIAGCATILSLALLAWYSAGSSATMDFDVFYAGARAVRDGLDPYQLIGPGRAFEWWTPLYYPLPALLLLAPLTWLSLDVARYVFVGGSAFALSYGLAGQRRPWMFAMLASQGYVSCVAMGQWSVVLLAAVFLPVIRGIVVTKPNVGLAVFAATRRRQDLIPLALGGAALILASFLVWPDWFASWRATLALAPQTRAVVKYPGGVLVLTALLRWRRPEARYLVALALVPQSPGPYSDLLLFAIPRTRWEVLCLAVLSYCTLPISDALAPLPTVTERMLRYGQISAVVMMLPCLAMVLRRPNVGAVPTWLEALTTRLPTWLRGRPDTGQADSSSLALPSAAELR